MTFVSVSSPVYWPSNLAEPCAHATLASPVLSRRPSPSHLNIAPPSQLDGKVADAATTRKRLEGLGVLTGPRASGPHAAGTAAIPSAAASAHCLGRPGKTKMPGRYASQPAPRIQPMLSR